MSEQPCRTEPDHTDQAILVVDDEPASTHLLRVTLGLDYQVYTANDGPSGLALLAEHPEIALAIVDQRMPGMSGTEFIQRTIEPYPNLVRIILTGYTDVEALIEAINAGRVYRYLTKPWEQEELRVAVHNGLQVHRLAVENQQLQEELRAANARLRFENVQLKREARGRYRFEEIVGTSAALRRALDLVERVVTGDTTVLITGETGTGKELFARAIHYNGARADKPFVSENCAALAPDLLTSELFGHKRGSFTGALEDRPGLFEMAQGGTLFLDEIGDCPLELQMRLLRVLDQGEIRRVGDQRSVKVDVRVIAATHHDLANDVAAGTFRKDLFYRLSVFTISVPPLRQRLDDVPLLAQHFLQAHMARTNGKTVAGFTAAALASLGAYDYPGNVRELKNEVERAFMLADAGDFIAPELLSDKFTAAELPLAKALCSLRARLEHFEIQCLREALEHSGGNQTRAAMELGLGRRTLIEKLQKYRLR